MRTLNLIVFKKAISRRAMLRGAGAALALPLLDSMVPVFTARAATPAQPVNRFGVMYVPNGMIMQNYLPAAEGAAYELTPTLSALAPASRPVTGAERPDLYSATGTAGRCAREGQYAISNRYFTAHQ